MYILVGFIITIIGLLLIRIEKRSLINGIIFSFGIIFLLLSVFFAIANFIYNSFPKYNQLLELSTYFFIFIVFLNLLIFTIYSISKYFRKEHIDKIIGMFILFILNFSSSIWGTLYFFVMDGKLSNETASEVLSIIVLLDFLLCCMFIFYLIYSLFYQFFPVKEEVSYIIILGSGIRSLELPPLLKSRVDKAIEIYYSSKAAPTFIVSGGQGNNEPYSEAFAMANYLYTKGFSKDMVLIEDESKTTYENMLNSAEVIKKHKGFENINGSVIFTTNNYHVFRAAIYAKRAGLNANGVGAPTAFYFLPSALLREFIALLFMHKLSMIILFSITVLLFLYF